MSTPREEGGEARPPDSIETVVDHVLATVGRSAAGARSFDGLRFAADAELQRDLGLDSLKVLEVAAVLGDRLLGSRASGAVVPITDVRSVGDLRRVFRAARAELRGAAVDSARGPARTGEATTGDATTGDAAIDDAMQASLQRAARRRGRRRPS